MVHTSLKATLVGFLLCACTATNPNSNFDEFKTLMDNISQGWSTQNTDLALQSFSEDAIYMQPPNTQFYQGHDQLRPYFDELTSVHRMTFHNLWFNTETQTGVGEFTFSYGMDTADVGIAVVELENGKIRLWREYLTKGPTDFQRFLSTEGKEWEWHIGNYPAPKEND